MENVHRYSQSEVSDLLMCYIIYSFQLMFTNRIQKWYFSCSRASIDFKPQEGFSLFMLRPSQFGQTEGWLKNWEDQNMKIGEAEILKIWKILALFNNWHFNIGKRPSNFQSQLEWQVCYVNLFSYSMAYSENIHESNRYLQVQLYWAKISKFSIDQDIPA